MCLLMTLAAGCPLPTTPFDAEHRHIAVFDLTNRRGAAYHKRLMTLPYAYDVTSRYGCACGLRTTADTPRAGETSSVLTAAAHTAWEDFQRVVDLAEQGLAAGPVELFTCWDSDCFNAEVESQRTVTLAELRRPGFSLVEGQLLRVMG